MGSGADTRIWTEDLLFTNREDDAPGTHLSAFARLIGAHRPPPAPDSCPSLLTMSHDGPVTLLRLALAGVSSGVTGDGMAMSNGR